MFFALNQDNQATFKEFLAKLSDRTEFEIRFGRFIFNKTTQRKEFVSEAELELFYGLKRAFSGHFKHTKTVSKEFIYDNPSGNGNIKRILRDDKEDFMLKNSFRKYNVYEYDMRLSLASEKSIGKPSNLDLNAFKLIREKERFSYSLPIGVLDLTIVKESNSSGQVQTKHEVELEVKVQDYDSIIQYLTIILQVRQNNIYIISNTEKRNIHQEYKSIVGTPFFVGAQPETLQKHGIANLYKEKYSVTDKADGDRAFMFITKSQQVYFMDSNLNNISKTDVKSTSYHSCIIDGELVHANNKVYFLAFDLVAYNGKDLRGNTEYLLATRLNRLNDIIKSTPSNDKYILQMKKFFYNNVFLGSETILDSVSSKPYKNDGLIFTPMDEPYPSARKWPKLLKWKPAELNTIDFFSKKVSDNTWELYVQHKDNKSGSAQKPSTLALFDVEKLCPTPSPVQALTFKTSFDDSIIDPTTGEPYQTNTVIEYRWNTVSSKFVPLRTRWDKTANPNKHGNFSTVACDIWNNIHNPIEKDLLFKFTTYNNKGDFFFERMRKYHNKIKEVLYNKYTKNCEYLLELCSGKGGDLHKWLYNNVKHVVGYDISEKSIVECERRLHTTLAGKEHTLNGRFFKLDLCADDALSTITKQNTNQFPVVCCQFGVHYFFKSEHTFNNLVDILDATLQQNGHFVVTFMDDKMVNDLFDKHGRQSGTEQYCYREQNNEIIYYLKRQVDTSQSKFGNKLRIVLNGNNVLNEGSDEYVVNYATFVDYMSKRNYSVVDTGMFEALGSLSSCELTEYERDISFLNRYVVFKKRSSCDVRLPRETVIPVLGTQKTEFNFETISLHQKHISVVKLTSKYDIIDALNCIEYKYYKNIIADSTIHVFEDIANTFNEMKIPYKPVYVHDPLDFNSLHNTKGNVYFTYHKHVIERKNDECEDIEYDNWYLVLHKGLILFEVSELQPQETQQTTQPQETQQTTRRAQVKQELEKTKTVTIKLLKSYLQEFGLKVSGNKDELLQRLVSYCDNSK